MVVNGEEADGSYFKIVADYIHLNPLRAGWVGENPGKRLRSWRWSSFGAYAGGKVPGWLETGRVLHAFQLSEDGRGERVYARYLEARAKDRKGVMSDEALVELRRGWYLGERAFGEKVLESIKAVGGKRKRSSVEGAAAKAHDEAEAERLVVAALVRNRTALANHWVAARQGMGHEVSVTRAVRRFREDPKATRKLKAPERKLGIR